jgi:hypothetical protein
MNTTRFTVRRLTEVNTLARGMAAAESAIFGTWLEAMKACQAKQDAETRGNRWCLAVETVAADGTVLSERLDWTPFMS